MILPPEFWICKEDNSLHTITKVYLCEHPLHIDINKITKLVKTSSHQFRPDAYNKSNTLNSWVQVHPVKTLQP